MAGKGKPGRPKLPDARKTVLTLRCSAQQARQIRRAAKTAGVTVSTYLLSRLEG